MKRIVLMTNPYRDKQFKTVLEAGKILQECGFETRSCLAFNVEKDLELPSDITFYNLEQEIRRADLIICFGGDGTILHAAKAAVKANVPVLGVNIGNMGFIAELENDELDLLRSLADGKYSIEKRGMLSVQVIRDGACILRDTAFNDAVVTKGAVARMIQMTVMYEGVDAVNMSGDGLIICTPTGSTAYSMSAGGPIVEPTAHNMIITPICAHDMLTRPFVTADTAKIGVRIGRVGRKNAFLSIDGGRAFRLNTGDVVSVTRSKLETQLIRLKKRNFLEVFNYKFRCR